ncbi:MAG: hypothetical protein ACJ76H_16190 [Bacteriovoracaceae bacterium]
MKIKDSNIRKILEDHQFPDNRGLNDYIELFGFPFAEALKALKGMHHWLDAGAGQGRAIQEFLLATSKKDIFTTAVSLKMSEKISSPTHKTIVNYLEDLTQDMVRPCDIITDVGGGLQYCEQPDYLLKRYLLWLKPEGKIFVFIKPESTFVNEQQFAEWLKAIPGLYITDGSVSGAMIIEKKPMGHAIPRLKLLETKIEDNLLRKFKEQ